MSHLAAKFQISRELLVRQVAPVYSRKQYMLEPSGTTSSNGAEGYVVFVSTIKIFQELLVDLTYCVYDGHLFCERHYAER